MGRNYFLKIMFLLVLSILTIQFMTQEAKAFTITDDGEYAVVLKTGEGEIDGTYGKVIKFNFDENEKSIKVSDITKGIIPYNGETAFAGWTMTRNDTIDKIVTELKIDDFISQGEMNGVSYKNGCSLYARFSDKSLDETENYYLKIDGFGGKVNGQYSILLVINKDEFKTIDLSKYGITDVKEVLHNPSYDVLFAEETKPGLEGFEKGQVTELGAVNVMTGVYTGRSPKDKFFVKNEASENSVWWTSDEYKNDNKPCTEEAWADLKAKAVKELSGKRLFVVDTFCGANEATRMKVRFIMEVAWQAHFVTNMFIRPTAEELANYGEPDFVSFNASKAKVDNYKELGLNSETATVFNLKTNEQVILNTWYGGEMKKGMFSIMNYKNPLRGIASMHCSANTNMEGTDSAIFFGLSGTGKTTLSTDPKRLLIGDDEHGWDDEGVFNYEGGCYAKVINLDKESEPDIYNAIKRDALLENVTVDADGKIDFADKSTTENTRVSYPIYHINNIVKPVSKGPHAHQVIFLSADAFGVLPPVSILNPEQAQYYFLSGFTAKLAGTERGITEPTPTFSACFGAAFLSLHPTKYAEELVKKMNKVGAKAYLVNTGWNGSGKRISIKDTRGIIDAILDGSIDKAPTKVIPYFDFVVPTELPGVDPKILDPRDTYECACQWEEKAKDLAGRFIKNFAKFTGNEAGKALVAAGPKL